MASISEAFAAKARELYPDDGQLHAEVAAGNGVKIADRIAKIHKRDYIVNSYRFRSDSPLDPFHLLERLNEHGSAAFKDWLDAHVRCVMIRNAWDNELSENPKLDEEVADALEAQAEEREEAEA